MFRKKSPASNFGRNRPPSRMGGAPSGAAVFSYHAKRSARTASTGRSPVPDGAGPLVTADSLQRKAQKRHIAKRTLVFGGLVLAAALIGLNIPLTDEPKLQAVGSSAASQVFLQSTATYQAAAQDILAGSKIRNSNKLTVDRQNVAKELKARFPELVAVEVLTPFIGHHLVIEVYPASPALLLTSTQGQTFLLDAAGRALISAKEVSGLNKFKLFVVKDDSGLEISLGKTILPTSSVAFITEIVTQLQAKKLTVASLTLPAATHQLEVKVKDTPYVIRFSLEGDARAEVGTYLATKEYVERTNTVPASYIDVRVDGRAFYR